jgi:hypothetical protein
MERSMSNRSNTAMEEEDEEIGHAMPFGDTFLQRADYEKGMLYQGRRRFLNDDDDNALRPPHEFMTRMQSLKFAHMQSGDNMEKLQAMALVNEHKMAEQNLKVLQQNAKRKDVIRKKAVQKIITLEKFSSTDPDDWEEEILAGCHMWTNHSTGEVSEVCPFEDEEISPVKPEADNEPEEGTGAPVYDGAELQGLFDYLDAHPSPATSPVKAKSVA